MKFKFNISKLFLRYFWLWIIYRYLESFNWDSQNTQKALRCRYILSAERTFIAFKDFISFFFSSGDIFLHIISLTDSQKIDNSLWSEKFLLASLPNSIPDLFRDQETCTLCTILNTYKIILIFNLRMVRLFQFRSLQLILAICLADRSTFWSK